MANTAGWWLRAQEAFVHKTPINFDESKGTSGKLFFCII
jgi:hypothetical protein